MSKKGFKSEFSSLLGNNNTPPPVNEQQPHKDNKQSLQNSVIEKIETVAPQKIEGKELEIRATFIVQESLLEKIKSIAYWDRLQIKEVVNDALSNYLQQWEAKNGHIKPPKK